MTCADVSSFCVQAWTGSPAAAIAASVLVAAVVESPGARHRAIPRAATFLTIAAAILFVTCGALAGAGLALGATLVLAAALASAAGAVWWLRDPVSGDNGGGGGGRGPDVPPPQPPGDPVDWDAFERDFAAYVDTGRRVPVA